MAIDFELDFDLNDFNIDMSLDCSLFGDNTRYIKPKIQQPYKEKNIKYKYAVEAVKDIILEKNMRYNYIVSGQFIFGDFIEALAVEKNLLIYHMLISTLSLSQNNVDSLYNLINGDYLKKLDMIVSAYFYSHEKHKLIPYIYKALDKDNMFQLAVARTHCKITLIKTGDLKLVIHGSANLRSSNSMEQITIEENPELYDFYIDNHIDIIDKYKTINKEVN